MIKQIQFKPFSREDLINGSVDGFIKAPLDESCKLPIKSIGVLIIDDFRNSVIGTCSNPSDAGRVIEMFLSETGTAHSDYNFRVMVEFSKGREDHNAEMSTNLELCPFCGDSNMITEPYYDESYVRCQKCGCNGPIGNYSECETRWNARVKAGAKSHERRFILRAAALEKETYEKVTESIFDLKEQYCSGQLKYNDGTNDNPSYETIIGVTELAHYLLHDNVFKKVERPIEWRDGVKEEIASTGIRHSDLDGLFTRGMVNIPKVTMSEIRFIRMCRTVAAETDAKGNDDE